MTTAAYQIVPENDKFHWRVIPPVELAKPEEGTANTQEEAFQQVERVLACVES
jgi:hypothetical protein